MTDEHFDALLKQALIECIKRDWLEPTLDPEVEVWNTDELDERIAKLSKNPVRYIKALNRPWYMKALRSAAAVLIAVSILFAASMLNPDARAWFRELIKKWFGDHNEYSYSDRYNQAVDRDWIFEYIPEGYVEDYKDVTEHEYYIEFINGENDLLSISITGGAGTIYKDNENYEIEQIIINNDIADAYTSLDSRFSNAIVWHNSVYDVVIMIDAGLDISEMIEIAKGIIS